jgi:hypothetical protein
MQVSPVSHGLPQRPQCSPDVDTSTQPPPQSSCPSGHVAIGRQEPDSHVSSEAHAIPHEPQLAGFVWRS